MAIYFVGIVFGFTTLLRLLSALPTTVGERI
jgi:hypothetical protein